MYKFAAASENELIVFGSSRPGYTNKQVNKWSQFMQSKGIQRVCCLLPETQLTLYSNLLIDYRKVFGLDQVCWAPIEDFRKRKWMFIAQAELGAQDISWQHGS